MGRVAGFVVGVVALGLVGLSLRTVPAVLAADGGSRPLVGTSGGTAQPTPTGSTDPPAGASTAASPQPSATATSAAKAEPQRTKAPKTEPQKSTPAERITVPARGPGTYVRGKAHVKSATRTGRLVRYDLRIEKGLHIDPVAAGEFIESVLNDKRSWRGSGAVRFELVPAGQQAGLHAYLVTPGTTDRLCAPLLTRGAVSCENGNKVVLNAKRWVKGAAAYGDDVTNYRRYLVNHEFGHSLGYNHVGCPGQGKRAPVMMQQTKGLGGCRQNPWPRPDQS